MIRGGVEASFTYDASGARAAARYRNAGEQSHFVEYAGRWFERDGTGERAAAYVYGEDGLIAILTIKRFTRMRSARCRW